MSNIKERDLTNKKNIKYGIDGLPLPDHMQGDNDRDLVIDGSYKKNKDIYGTDNTAVQLIEQQYPKTTDEFKRLQKLQYEVFCEKQMDYGPSNISVGTDLSTEADVKLSLTGLWFRMNDKIQRIKNLLMNNQKVNNEPLEDSYLDVSNYGIMATIVKNGKWGK